MKKRFGFTLAEVLITLGIIGVVAAMTIPTLIANTNSARFRSQFKKSMSTLSQAGLMAQAQYDIDYSTNVNDSCGQNPDQNDPDTTFDFCAIFNGTLSGHSISATAPIDKNNNSYNNPLQVSNAIYLQLADGSLVVFDGSAHGCHKGIGDALADVDSSCRGFIDVNGTTLPTRVVSCGEAGGMLAQPAYAEGDQQGGGGAAIEVTDGTCVVPNDAAHMTDVYPIVFHDGTVEPASQAARYVLTTSK